MSDKSSSESDLKPLTPNDLKPFVWFAVVSIALVFGTYAFYFGGDVSVDHGRWGQFGDYIGGLLNPLFGLLSFAALLVALVLQSKELHASTKELKASAEALEAQHEVLTKQSFENTYFQMLRKVGEIVSEMEYGNLTGRKALESLYEICKRNIVKYGSSTEKVRATYDTFYLGQGTAIGHYFRTLYHVFTLIDHAPNKEDEKVVYANIARAQLSDFELALLFYNCTTGEGAEGFKPLIEKYGLLKHVRVDILADPNDRDNPDFYSPTAFMSANEREIYNSKSD